MRRCCAAVAALLLAACSNPSPSSEAAFHLWLEEDAPRAAAFRRFELLLEREGVLNVVPAHELWRTDQLRRECVTAPFTPPPEDAWGNIVPVLRFVRDQVKHSIGDVRVVSAYRDENFNRCVRGAPLSAHRGFYALDLVPADRAVSRERLIQTLCPIHARAGAEARIGLGIYTGQRFHLDARGFRGWGADFRRATFPCDERAVGSG
ncbi:MAG: D-Ala-D-Ala carboxypeptidase family metallohydrolase [Hyphomonadaceae bacterium]